MAWKALEQLSSLWYGSSIFLVPSDHGGCGCSGGQLPILTDFKHGCGFIHRLDVPSSGLVIAASTYDPLAVGCRLTL